MILTEKRRPNSSVSHANTQNRDRFMMTKWSVFRHGHAQVLHKRQRSQRQQAMVRDLIMNRQGNTRFNQNLQINRMQHELKKIQTLQRKGTEKEAIFNSYSNQSQSNYNNAMIMMKERIG